MGANKLDVKLIAYTQCNKEIGPEEICAFGAMGCHSEESSINLINEFLNTKNKDEINETCKTVFDKSAAIGHGSVLDQSYFTFSIENLPRLATLFICTPEYLSHLQQSMRFVSAKKGYTLPESIVNSNMNDKTEKILKDSFEVYETLVEKGLPIEDARYLLPLYSKTNIQTTGNVRELGHLFYMADSHKIPSSVKEVINQMKEKSDKTAPNLFKYWKKDINYFATYPSAQLFMENKTFDEIIKQNNYPENVLYVDYEISNESFKKAIVEKNEAEYANLKNIHDLVKMEGFLIPMSVACFHQAIRQRTWNHTIEDFYSAAERRNFVIPPSIKNSEYLEMYKNQNEEMFSLYEELIKEGIPKEEAIGVLPHSMEIYDFIHINGFNAIHSIGKRLCKKAQWEIRKIANDIAEIIKEKNPNLGNYAYPQGIVYKECPEEKPCGLCYNITKRPEDERH